MVLIQTASLLFFSLGFPTIMNVFSKSPPGVQQPIGTVPPTRFGGIGDAISNVIGYIDGNRVVELASTDILGMCLPRTGIEASLRPSGYRTDAAREAAIREFSGLVMNTVAVGGFSYLLLRLMGNQVNWYNPKGLPNRAWISADSLETFGKLYERILLDDGTHTPQATREQFIRTVLNSMASSNKKPGLIGMLKSVEALDEKARLTFLEPVFSENPEYLDKLKAILKTNPQNLVQYADELDAGYSGKLSAKALEGLVTHYGEKTNQFDLQAMKSAQKILFKDPKITQYLTEEHRNALKGLPQAERFDQLLKLLPKQAQADAQKIFTKSRLKLSLSELHYAEAGMVGDADRKALSGGLTDTIQLLDDKLEPLMRDSNGKPMMMSKSRKTLLREMKHFLEQYVDRAIFEARESESEWKNKVHTALYGSADQAPGHFWNKGISRLDDGLIPAAIKSKWAFTWIPIIVTVGASVGVAFYNNWLTQKKHGGRVISPIDGSTPDGAMTAVLASSASPESLSQPSIPQDFASIATQSGAETSTSSPFNVFQYQTQGASR
jgi:hypothetical protein